MTATATTSEKTIVMDVAGISVGRAATAIATALRGKDRASFRPNVPAGVRVEVKNADQMKIVARRLKGKFYTRYTGYPGGLRRERLGDVFRNNPKEVLRRAVYGMLPKNKLRRIFMKHLIFV